MQVSSGTLLFLLIAHAYRNVAKPPYGGTAKKDSLPQGGYRHPPQRPDFASALTRNDSSAYPKVKTALRPHSLEQTHTSGTEKRAGETGGLRRTEGVRHNKYYIIKGPLRL